VAFLGSAFALPVLAREQQPGRVRRIGVLIPIVQTRIQRALSAFLQALHASGWTEDRSVRIEYRWTGEDPDRMRADANELISLNPDVILAHGGPVVSAVQKATRTIPIVFVQVPDPIEAGLVKSLAHPGGNMTGFTNYEPEMGGKWLQMLKQIAPNTSRVLLIMNRQSVSFTGYLNVINATADSLGLLLSTAEVQEATDIVDAIDTFGREPNGGMVVVPNPVTTNYSRLIIESCVKHSLPAVYPFRFFTENGGLMSYGSDTVDMYRRAALYVDQVLKGANAGDLPVQQPTKFELVINRKTAKALGLDVPPMLIVRADDVID